MKDSSSIQSKVKNSMDRTILNIIGYTIVSIVSIACLLPFLLVIGGSFTSEAWIEGHGYQLFPFHHFSLAAYKFAFKFPQQIITGYEITISLTILGTIIGLLLTTMTAYVLQRPDFPWKRGLSFFYYFTTLFNAGLVPWYIMNVDVLHLANTYLVLLLSPLLNVLYIFMMRSFMRSIPESITEAAKIDGANDFVIFFRLILPLSMPALATIGLFIALTYWNDWFNASIFITNQNLYPLQYFLYETINNIQGYESVAAVTGGQTMTGPLPTEGLKMALTVIVVGPIVLLYSFVQRFLVEGMTIGAVKG